MKVLPAMIVALVLGNGPSSAPTSPTRTKFIDPSGSFSILHRADWSIKAVGPQRAGIFTITTHDGSGELTISCVRGVRLPTPLPDDAVDAGFVGDKPATAVFPFNRPSFDGLMRSYYGDSRDGLPASLVGIVARRADTVVLISARDSWSGMKEHAYEFAQIILSLELYDPQPATSPDNRR